MRHLLVLFMFIQTFQALAACHDELSPSTEAVELGELGMRILAEEYQQTDFGYQIDPQCMGSTDGFMTLARATITEGLNCMAAVEGPGAARNLQALRTLLATNSVQLVCSETSFNWRPGNLGHATLGADSTSSLTHPAISINPSFVENISSKSSAEIQNFKEVFFHEQLHNLGFPHGLDIEYPYACGICCFPKENLSASGKADACKLCGGDYRGLTDPRYIADLSFFGKSNGRPHLPIDPTIALIKENPSDMTGAVFLAFNLSNVFNPVGSSLAQLLEERQTLGINGSINSMAIQRSNALFGPYPQSSRVIGEAFFDLFVTGDVNKMMGTLLTKTSQLQVELDSPVLSPGDGYVKEELRRSLAILQREVVRKGYRGRSPAINPSEPDQISRDLYEFSNRLQVPSL